MKITCAFVSFCSVHFYKESLLPGGTVINIIFTASYVAGFWVAELDNAGLTNLAPSKNGSFCYTVP